MGHSRSTRVAACRARRRGGCWAAGRRQRGQLDALASQCIRHHLGLVVCQDRVVVWPCQSGIHTVPEGGKESTGQAAGAVTQPTWQARPNLHGRAALRHNVVAGHLQQVHARD